MVDANLEAEGRRRPESAVALERVKDVAVEILARMKQRILVDELEGKLAGAHQLVGPAVLKIGRAHV